MSSGLRSRLSDRKEFARLRRISLIFAEDPGHKSHYLRLPTLLTKHRIAGKSVRSEQLSCEVPMFLTLFEVACVVLSKTHTTHNLHICGLHSRKRDVEQPFRAPDFPESFCTTLVSNDGESVVAQWSYCQKTGLTTQKSNLATHWPTIALKSCSITKANQQKSDHLIANHVAPTCLSTVVAPGRTAQYTKIKANHKPMLPHILMWCHRVWNVHAISRRAFTVMTMQVKAMVPTSHRPSVLPEEPRGPLKMRSGK